MRVWVNIACAASKDSIVTSASCTALATTPTPTVSFQRSASRARGHIFDVDEDLVLALFVPDLGPV